MGMILQILAWIFVLYVAAGAVTALAFVTVGIEKVLPAGTPVSAATRMLLAPGALALWPLVLRRWLGKAAPR